MQPLPCVFFRKPHRRGCAQLRADGAGVERLQRYHHHQVRRQHGRVDARQECKCIPWPFKLQLRQDLLHLGRGRAVGLLVVREDRVGVPVADLIEAIAQVLRREGLGLPVRDVEEGAGGAQPLDLAMVSRSARLRKRQHRRASKSIALTSPNQPPAASKILPELQHSPHVSARTPARAGGRSPSASGRGRGSPGDLLGGEKGDHRRDVVRLPQLHELVRHHRRRHRPGTQQGRTFARIHELDLAELKRCRGRGLAQMHTCADAVQPRLGDAHVPAPGATTLTLMLRFSPSCARVLEKPTIPILAAE